MNATEIAREHLKMNSHLPRYIIRKVEESLQGYDLTGSDLSLSAFNDLLDNFVDLYQMEGSKAVETFKRYLIK